MERSTSDPYQQAFCTVAKKWKLSQILIGLEQAQDKKAKKNQINHLKALLTWYDLKQLNLLREEDIAKHPAVVVTQILSTPQKEFQEGSTRTELNRSVTLPLKLFLGFDEDDKVEVRDIPKLLDRQGYRKNLDWQKYLPEPPENLCGRDSEIQTVESNILNENTRLVILRGHVGIGKTAIAHEITNRLKDDFHWIGWYSFRDENPSKRIIGRISANLKYTFSDIYSEFNTWSMTDEIHSFLRDNRCLLILDDCHLIINKNLQFLEEFKEYESLFRNHLIRKNKSCILLLSQENFPSLIRSEKRKIFDIELEGLDKAYSVKKNSFLLLKKIVGEKIFNAYDPFNWQVLVSAYNGNPLFLTIVTESMLETQNIGKYFNTSYLGELEYWLHNSYQRCSDIEKEVIKYSSIRETSFTLSELCENLNSFRTSQLIDAIKLLRNRSWIMITSFEEKEPLFSGIEPMRKFIKSSNN